MTMTGRTKKAGMAVLSALMLLAAISIAPGTASAATASWEYNVSSYDFGLREPDAGPSEAHEFVLTNTGEVELHIAGWGIGWTNEGGGIEEGLFRYSSVHCGGHALEPGESCTFEVTFDPSRVGPKRGSIGVGTVHEEVPPLSVELTGEGAGSWVTLNRTEMPFELIVVGSGSSPPQTAVLENRGSEPTTVEDVHLAEPTVENYFDWPTYESPDPDGAFVLGGTCHPGLVLAGHENCTIEASLQSAAVGYFRSKVVEKDSASGPPRSIALTGGVKPPFEAFLHVPEPPPGEPALGSVPTPEAEAAAGGDPVASEAPPARTAPPLTITYSVRHTHASSGGGGRLYTFDFASRKPGAKFLCGLDKTGLEPCRPPTTYRDLGGGPHRFRVKAVYAGGTGSSLRVLRFVVH